MYNKKSVSNNDNGPPKGSQFPPHVWEQMSYENKKWILENKNKPKKDYGKQYDMQEDKSEVASDNQNKKDEQETDNNNNEKSSPNGGNKKQSIFRRQNNVNTYPHGFHGWW